MNPDAPIVLPWRPAASTYAASTYDITQGIQMNIHLTLTPLISLIAGILILAMPKLLNFIIAIYLILIGLVGLFGSGGLHL